MPVDTEGGVSEDILTEITVNDLYGRQVFQISEYLRTDSLLDIDLTEKAASGIFFVTVKNGTNRLVQKLIVQ